MGGVGFGSAECTNLGRYRLNVISGLFSPKLLRSFGPRHCDIVRKPGRMHRIVVDATLKIRPSAGIGPMGVDLGSVRLNAMLMYT